METTKTEKKPIKSKEELLNALQLTLVEALQRRDIAKALQCSKLYALISKGSK